MNDPVPRLMRDGCGASQLSKSEGRLLSRTGDTMPLLSQYNAHFVATESIDYLSLTKAPTMGYEIRLGLEGWHARVTLRYEIGWAWKFGMQDSYIAILIRGGHSKKNSLREGKPTPVLAKVKNMLQRLLLSSPSTIPVTVMNPSAEAYLLAAYWPPAWSILGHPAACISLHDVKWGPANYYVAQ